MSDDFMEKFGTVGAFLATWLGILVLVMCATYALGGVVSIPLPLETWHEVAIAFLAAVVLFVRERK